MNQLLRNNNVENSLKMETINSSLAGNNKIKNGTTISDLMPTKQEDSSNYEEQQMHVRH